MAAYPMVQAPKRAEFIEKVTKKYDATVETSKSNVQSPRGPVTFTSLKRVTDGKTYVALLPDIGPDERIPAHLVRSICVQLRIPPKDFGFVLDELPRIAPREMPKEH